MLERNANFVGSFCRIAGFSACLLLLAGSLVKLHAADYANLPVVKPVVSCLTAAWFAFSAQQTWAAFPQGCPPVDKPNAP